MKIPENFGELVAADLRNNASDEIHAWLRSPEILDAWHDELSAIARSVDTQLTHHKAERARRAVELADDPKKWQLYLAEAATSRANILHFKRNVADRLAEAKTIRRALYRDRVLTARAGEIARLRAAICAHKAASEGGHADMELADAALYALVADVGES